MSRGRDGSVEGRGGLTVDVVIFVAERLAGVAERLRRLPIDGRVTMSNGGEDWSSEVGCSFPMLVLFASEGIESLGEHGENRNFVVEICARSSSLF